MEEILASIRRIIADDDTTKAPPKGADPVPPPPPHPMMQRPEPVPPPPPPRAAFVAPPPEPEPAMRQADIDAMLSTLNAAAAPPVEEPPAPDILELTESMATEEASPPSDSFRTIDGQSDVVFEDRPYEPDPVPPPRHALFGGDSLISSATSSAVDSAFNTLAQTVLVQNARTLEDLVREMLRPMLKSWLDDNLPGLVERLVRAEIERVSRGRT
jgi:uncharacterized protein